VQLFLDACSAARPRSADTAVVKCFLGSVGALLGLSCVWAYEAHCQPAMGTRCDVSHMLRMSELVAYDLTIPLDGMGFEVSSLRVGAPAQKA
jgi:hypothetical protein